MNDAQKILKLEQYISILKKAIEDKEETIKKLNAQLGINRGKWAE
jgi:flagellar biosynthesis chaperone FliJ|tara:strand:+ start:3085 stop:3219 length:135 start_codon:yes stop_codon:yes gene_type:complete